MIGLFCDINFVGKFVKIFSVVILMLLGFTGVAMQARTCSGRKEKGGDMKSGDIFLTDDRGGDGTFLWELLKRAKDEGFGYEISGEDKTDGGGKPFTEYTVRII